MPVSAISSTSSSFLQGAQSTQASAFKQRKQDFDALSQALNSGNLAGAQSAFSALQQDLKNISQGQSVQPAGQSAQNGQTSAQSALQSLGQALSSGNLAGAQSAFAQLEQDIQSSAQGSHHHHHHQSGSVQSNSAPQSSATGGGSTVQPSTVKTTA